MMTYADCRSPVNGQVAPPPVAIVLITCGSPQVLLPEDIAGTSAGVWLFILDRIAEGWCASRRADGTLVLIARKAPMLHLERAA